MYKAEYNVYMNLHKHQLYLLEQQM